MYVWNYQLNFITLQAENTQGPGSCPPQWGTTFAAFVRLGVSSLVSVVSGKTWTERLMLGLKPSTLNWESRGSPNLPSTIMIIIYIYILYIYYNMEHKLHNPKKRRQSVRPRKVFCSSAGRTSTILQPWKQHNSQWTWRPSLLETRQRLVRCLGRKFRKCMEVRGWGKQHMGVTINGDSQKICYNGNHIKMDDLGLPPRKPPHAKTDVKTSFNASWLAYPAWNQTAKLLNSQSLHATETLFYISWIFLRAKAVAG